ncbi:MAG: hypothetical protein M1837_002789 [Sclerophora amabilis]|nr:MAG: hypothetical protein M1837_002789 [Sclerophora amabilis]
MRPNAGGDLLGRGSRKSSVSDVQLATPTPLTGRGHAAQTTYFLADEKSMEEALSRSETQARSKTSQRDSSYGVQSLADTIGEGVSREGESKQDDGGDDGDDEQHADDEPLDRTSESQRGSPQRSNEGKRPPRPDPPLSSRTSVEPSISQSPLPPASHLLSRPLTPLSLVSPVGGSSLASSPRSASTKSFRPSEFGSVMDDAASQAIISSGEDSDHASETQASALQLIMPSIKMPSRRPFTERGKNMGRLKVLMAGGSGVGKTSLIKSIVQICEDIVHVDPLVGKSPTLPKPSSKTSRSKNEDDDPNRTREITEIHASTKPYPTWWSDFDQGKLLRRRKSMGDTVLERNLCFVDTPGYGNGLSLADSMESVIRYMEAQMTQTASVMSTTNGDALGLLSGNGGSQVDVVFYVITDKVKPIDMEYCRRLSCLTNVIPIIAKAESQSSEAIASSKIAFLNEMRQANVRPFLFERSLEDALKTDRPCPPFAISCATANDSEMMDASLLMSPDYVQPLIPTELQALVERVFERDSISWLRHSAANKFLHWRNTSPWSLTSMRSPGRSESTGTSSSAGIDTSTVISAPQHSSRRSRSTPYYDPTLTYALARVTDHTQREERLAQVRLAKWADDLQRSLHNERYRYEALARGEHAQWLKEKVGERLIDGTLTLSAIEESMALVRHSSRPDLSPGSSGKDTSLSYPGHGTGFNTRDPLGLLDLNDKLWQRGWTTVKIVGSFGVIGGLAVLFARSWGPSSDGLISSDWSWWSGCD